MSESPKGYFHIDGTPADFEPLTFPRINSLNDSERSVLKATELDFMSDPNYSSMIACLLGDFPADKNPENEGGSDV